MNGSPDCRGCCRGNALAAMENVALWHERDITHSSVERVVIPDSCILLDYMLNLLDRCSRSAPRVSREYDEESRADTWTHILPGGPPCAHQAWNETGGCLPDRPGNRDGDLEPGKGISRRDLLENREVMGVISPEDLDSLFDLEQEVSNISTRVSAGWSGMDMHARSLFRNM